MDIAVTKPAVATARPRFLAGDNALGYALIAPAIFYIFALVAVPFLLALYFSVSSATISNPVGRFVGLDNFNALIHNQIFRQALRNSFVFTFSGQIVKGILGLFLAFLLLQNIPAKKVLRFFLMLPWTVPIALSTLGWKWMFDPEFSVINWAMIQLGLMDPLNKPNWLGETTLAMISVVTVNVWRGVPFGAVVLIAGMTSVSPDIIDAARVDGANFLQRWHYVIFPMILPILFVGLLFDVVFTFTDLSVIYLLTNGGPINSTHILPTLAFQNGIIAGGLGQGAATAVFMLPVLLVFIFFMLRFLRRRDI